MLLSLWLPPPPTLDPPVQSEQSPYVKLTGWQPWSCPQPDSPLSCNLTRSQFLGLRHGSLEDEGGGHRSAYLMLDACGYISHKPKWVPVVKRYLFNQKILETHEWLGLKFSKHTNLHQTPSALCVQLLPGHPVHCLTSPVSAQVPSRLPLDCCSNVPLHCLWFVAGPSTLIFYTFDF